MTAEPRDRPSIYVLAGTNGPGKSSVAGAEVEACEVTSVPQWAKPLFIAALRQYST